MGVQIDFDKPRELKFTIPACQDLEANMGGQPLSVVTSLIAQRGATAITTALWAGLKADDPTLTRNLVTKMFQRYLDEGRNIQKLTRPLIQALEDTGLFKYDEDLEGNA